MAFGGGVPPHNIRTRHELDKSDSPEHNFKAQQESKCLFRHYETAGLSLPDGQKKEAATKERV